MSDWKVGDECSIGTIMCIKGNEVCVYTKSIGLCLGKLDAIKPLKSPEEQKRDDVLDAACKVVLEDGSSHINRAIEALYDAGMLVEPGDKVDKTSWSDFELAYDLYTDRELYHALIKANHIKPA